MVTLKYVLILLRADNQGEGGTLSLTALATRALGRRSPVYRSSASSSLNKNTGHRIKYRKVDAETGELDPEELEAVAIDSKRTIDIDKFVPRDQIDELYLNNPYYIAPNGEVGQQAFAVIREAIHKEGMVAIGKDIVRLREEKFAPLRWPRRARSSASQSGYDLILAEANARAATWRRTRSAANADTLHRSQSSNPFRLPWFLYGL